MPVLSPWVVEKLAGAAPAAADAFAFLASAAALIVPSVMADLAVDAAAAIHPVDHEAFALAEMEDATVNHADAHDDDAHEHAAAVFVEVAQTSCCAL